MMPSMQPLTTDERVVYEQVYPINREKPISRNALVNKVNRHSLVPMRERKVRDLIKDVRRKGGLILSMPGINGGYYMARSQDEYDAFQREEFEAKILDMLETKRAMDEAASKLFGQAEQLTLNL
jgi:hypothetical protein